MWQDPFTLVVALSRDGTAKGQLYLDDGETFGYNKGEYIWREFEYTSSGKGGKGILRSSSKSEGKSGGEGRKDVTPWDEGNAWAKAMAHVKIEKIVLVGVGAKVASVKVSGEEVQWGYESGKGVDAWLEGKAGEVVVKNPGVGVLGDWEVVFE